MEVASIVISLGAFILSAISLIWQLSKTFAYIEIEVIDVFKIVSEVGPQYIFRLHIINKSSSPISISKIFLKNQKDWIMINYAEMRLINLVNKITTTKIVDGSQITSEKIVGTGNLYSHPFPFRIDGDGVEGGYFYLLDAQDILEICDNTHIEAKIYTNKKIINLNIRIREVKSWDDVEICEH